MIIFVYLFHYNNFIGFMNLDNQCDKWKKQ